MAFLKSSHNYDHHTMQSTFVPDDPVWLSIPTAGKLDPRWEGEWVIKSVKGPVTMEICVGEKRTKVVHTNRLQHCYVPGQHDATELSNTPNKNDCLEWTPPSVEHVILQPTEQNMASRYPQRQRRPPDRYTP